MSNPRPFLPSERPVPSGGSEFVHLAGLLLNSSDPIDAVNKALGNYGGRTCPARVLAVLERAVVAPGGLSDPNWSGNIADFEFVAGGFVESLRSLGVFDRVLADAVAIPMQRGRLVATTSFATGAGAVKPLTQLSLEAPETDPLKASCVVVASSELARMALAGSMSFLSRELRAGVIAATDSVFVATLSASVTPITSVGGSDSTAVLSDLAALLSAVSLAPSSKPIFVFRPEDTKALALLAGASGGLLFPELGATGGQIAGVPVLPSDQLAAGTALLIDATGVACGSGALTLDSGEHTALQMSDSPAAGLTNTVSPLQADSKALRVERYFVSELARADAVALLENVAWASGS